MGCGTNSSAQGIIGMHAYSIIDVKEIKNVGLDFFRDKLVDRSLGNVSGFTSFDGTVRLLKIRNPHGKGAWGGERERANRGTVRTDSFDFECVLCLQGNGKENLAIIVIRGRSC